MGFVRKVLRQRITGRNHSTNLVRNQIERKVDGGNSTDYTAWLMLHIGDVVFTMRLTACSL